MITITNDQAIPIDTDQFKHDAQKVLDHLEYSDFDLGILLTTNSGIHDYNKKYRHKDKPTDILSFPFYPKLKAGERITPPSKDEENLGDIVISPEYVRDDLDQWNQSFEQRMQILLVHGICHLLGYDHLKDNKHELMKKKEQELLSMLQS